MQSENAFDESHFEQVRHVESSVNAQGTTESMWRTFVPSKWLVFKRPSVAGFQRPLTLIDEETRRPLGHPLAKVIGEGTIANLEDQAVLVAKDGTERPIEDS